MGTIYLIVKAKTIKVLEEILIEYLMILGVDRGCLGHVIIKFILMIKAIS